MDTLADAMPPPLDPTGRSFALLDETERDRLGALLRPLPFVDGLITAAVVSPAAPSEDGEDIAMDWVDCIWNEAGAAGIGALTLPESAAIVDPVLAHYAHVADTLCEEPETYRPYLAATGDSLAAASQWASGFWCGLSLNAGVWAPLLDDEDSRPLLTAVLSLVRDVDMPEPFRADSPFRDLPPEQLEHMRRSAVEMLPEIVLAFHDYALGPDEPGEEV
jgi:yecA family protein